MLPASSDSGLTSVNPPAEFIPLDPMVECCSVDARQLAWLRAGETGGAPLADGSAVRKQIGRIKMLDFDAGGTLKDPR